MLRPSLSSALVAALLCTGCFHWSRIDELDEAASAARVRIEPENGPPRILDHPSLDEVRDAAVEEHAHIAVEKLNGWATAGVIAGATLAIMATVVLPVLITILTQSRPIPVEGGGRSPPP